MCKNNDVKFRPLNTVVVKSSCPFWKKPEQCCVSTPPRVSWPWDNLACEIPQRHGRTYSKNLQTNSFLKIGDWEPTHTIQQVPRQSIFSIADSYRQEHKMCDDVSLNCRSEVTWHIKGSVLRNVAQKKDLAITLKYFFIYITCHW